MFQAAPPEGRTKLYMDAIHPRVLLPVWLRRAPNVVAARELAEAVGLAAGMASYAATRETHLEVFGNEGLRGGVRAVSFLLRPCAGRGRAVSWRCE